MKLTLNNSFSRKLTQEEFGELLLCPAFIVLEIMLRSSIKITVYFNFSLKFL